MNANGLGPQQQTHEPPAADGRTRGIRINFELTDACNFSCVHCLKADEKPGTFLALETIRKVLDGIPPIGPVDWVTFGGGEPTVHPRFEEILDVVCKSGHRFAFVTNGWNFRNAFEKLTPHLKRLLGVSFSLDGARADTHDALRRRPGSHREVLEAVLLCRLRGIPIHINMVVTRNNRAELESMALLASRLGVDVLDFGHCQPTPDVLAAGLVLNAEERRSVETEVAELQRIFRLRIRLAGDHYCPSPAEECPQWRMEDLNVDCRGRLTFCCMLSHYRRGTPGTDLIANLDEVTFSEAHRRLADKIAEVLDARNVSPSAGEPGAADRFLCTHCLAYFGKVPGIRDVLNGAAGPGSSISGENTHVEP